jgi:hypothetical protein
MITKAIIILWTMLIAWNCIDALYRANSHDGGYLLLLILIQILTWGVVIVPVALIGMLFKGGHTDRIRITK